MAPSTPPVLIPHEALSPETLKAMLSDFVTRDGTDYGLIEAETPTKIEEVFSKISRGEAHIIFDPDSETFTIVSKEALKTLNQL